MTECNQSQPDAFEIEQETEHFGQLGDVCGQGNRLCLVAE